MIFLLSCKGKGSVDGNIYWNYNKYVGDKPDAGADVYLFAEWNNEPALTAECNVRGDFKIANVPSKTKILLSISEIRSCNKKNLAIINLKMCQRAKIL